MPINRRVTEPEVRPQPVVRPAIYGKKISKYLRDVLERLPPIGMRGDRRSLILKYVAPNQHRYFHLNGFYASATPAYSAANPFDHSVTVLAALLIVPVAERPAEQPCSLRLAEPSDDWPMLIENFVQKLADNYTPRSPIKG